MKEITARLWENKLYGTTYGKGQYRNSYLQQQLFLNRISKQLITRLVNI